MDIKERLEAASAAYAAGITKWAKEYNRKRFVKYLEKEETRER